MSSDFDPARHVKIPSMTAVTYDYYRAFCEPYGGTSCADIDCDAPLFTDFISAAWVTRGSETHRRMLDTGVLKPDNVAPITRPAQVVSADDPKPSRFRPIPATELCAGDVKEPEWLIEDVIPLDGVGVFYGVSGSYKTFVVVGVAASINRGANWRDKAVKRGRAVIVVGEGGKRFNYRLRAYAKYHNVPLEELPDTVPYPVNLGDVREVDELVSQLKVLGAQFVAFDTFSSMTPGLDENNSKEVKAALHRIATRVSRELGAFACIVHHSGKNEAKGMRGSNAFEGDVDVIFKIEPGKITNQKMRDGPDGDVYPFKVTDVQLGTTKRGKPFGSLVVEHLDALPVEKAPLPELAQSVYDAAAELLRGQPSVTVKELREELEDELPDDTSNANRAVKRALKAIAARNLLKVSKDHVVSHFAVEDTSGDFDDLDKGAA